MTFFELAIVENSNLPDIVSFIAREEEAQVSCSHNAILAVNGNTGHYTYLDQDCAYRYEKVEPDGRVSYIIQYYARTV